MGYMKINDLYKDATILLFKKCYALEKIHGTSAHVGFKNGIIYFHPGGCAYNVFRALFDYDKLSGRFKELGYQDIIVYGEAYGGKIQGMSDTYGKDIKFIAFEVKIDNTWLSVDNAFDVAGRKLGLDFVWYMEIDANIKRIDQERDCPSIQSVRNGMGPMPREGVVLRPLEEFTLNSGKRVIAKHKAEAFQERVNQPKVGEDIELIKDAKKIAFDWATPMRLNHVLGSLFTVEEIDKVDATDTGKVIEAIISDIEEEAKGEAEITREVKRYIGRRTAKLFHIFVEKLHDTSSEEEE